MATDDFPEPVSLKVEAIVMNGEAMVGLFINGDLYLSSPPDGARHLAAGLVKCAEAIERVANGHKGPPV